MASDFEDLDSLWEYVTSEIKDIAKNEVVEKMKDVEQKVIQEVVLDTYTPTYYDRRSDDGDGSEGLIDRDNMILDYVESKDYIFVDMTNDTRGNTDYPKSTGGFIDEIIEYGTGYTWEYSEIYKNKQARPFTSETQKVLDTSGIVEKTIMDNLGFEIK